MGKKKVARPRTFFDVTVDGTPLGRIVFELFTDITPVTCENFRSLCVGDKGKGQTTGKNLHYKGSTFHRIVKNFMIQGGDFQFGNGTGGESIYGGTFSDESFAMKHDEPFLLSMANRGKDTNGSQFFILTHKAPHLDGVHVVFGKVVSGQNVVAELEALKVNSKSSRPEADVVINHCGELMLKKKKKKKRKKDSKKKAGSGSESSDSSESSEESEEEKEKEGASKENEAKAEEPEPEPIPEVPGNKFLMRRSKTPPDLREKREAEDKARGIDRREQRREREQRVKEAETRKPRVFVSRSGHKIRGRGAIRFRTPSPGREDRDRSVTPPHWKQATSGRISFKELTGTLNRDAEEEEEPAPAEDGKVEETTRKRSRSRSRERRRSDRSEKRPERRERSRRSRSRDRSSHRRGDRKERKRSRDRDSRKDKDDKPRDKKRKFREEPEVIKAAEEAAVAENGQSGTQATAEAAEAEEAPVIPESIEETGMGEVSAAPEIV